MIQSQHPESLPSRQAAPLVSVVIPCFNGARYLALAIESCLKQTYSNIELFIVDDAGQDNCPLIAREYARKDDRVRFIQRNRNGGISAALNTGYEQANGVYFTRLAQDDLFREDAIELMMRSLAENPGAGLVYFDAQVIDEWGQVVGDCPTAEPDEALERRNMVGLCVMWIREVWDKLGGFDSAFDTAEDYEYWLRIARHYPIIRCKDEAPFFVRVHDDMGSKRFAIRQMLAAYKARARHCGGLLESLLLNNRGHFEASFNYRMGGAYIRSYRHLFKAIGYWPWRLKNYRALAGLTVDTISSASRAKRAN